MIYYNTIKYNTMSIVFAELLHRSKVCRSKNSTVSVFRSRRTEEELLV